MPRYFFDLYDDCESSADDAGDHLESFEEASEQAIAILADVVREALSNRRKRTFGCRVRDLAGEVVYHAKLTFEDIRMPVSVAA